MTKEELVEFLKENLELSISEDHDNWFRSTKFDITLSIGEVTISKDSFYVNECRED